MNLHVFSEFCWREYPAQYLSSLIKHSPVQKPSSLIFLLLLVQPGTRVWTLQEPELEGINGLVEAYSNAGGALIGLGFIVDSQNPRMV